jgi:hypothetical protein
MIIGLIGVLLVLAIWILEVRKILGTKGIKSVDIKFQVVYLLGGVLLAYHASQTADYILILLGGAIAFLTLAEIVFVYVKNH